MQIEKHNYLGNVNVKRDGISQQWNREDIEEYRACMEDPCYFAENYCKIIHLDRGLVPFILYPYQKELFNHFEENRFNIILACRQSGKSITTVAYLLWYALFHPEKTIAILANKGVIAREMLARITLMLENLPFFLQVGCKALNKGSLEFSNNSRIIASATSGSSIRGMSINLLYLDEFAFVENATEFYTSTFPVITSGTTTKVIITSTANGLGNQFYRIWEGAEVGTNSYIPFRVDWWNVPGRDEKWKEQTIADTSPVQFDQEYGNNFHGTGSTLINANTLLALQVKRPIEINQEVLIYQKPVTGNLYTITVDCARGRGLDYSTFTIFDVSSEVFQQVAVYRSNLISPLVFPDIIVKYGKLYNDAWIVVESNDVGQVICNSIHYELEYENFFVESLVKNSALGVNMTKKVKRIGCSHLKDIVEQGKLNLVDEETIKECCTFIVKGSSYQADGDNHDDLVMNLVLFSYFSYTEFFQEITNVKLKKMLYTDRLQTIEDDLPSFGFIDDGNGENDVEYVKEGGELWEIDDKWG